MIFSFINRYLFWLIILVIVLGLTFVKLTGGYTFTVFICVVAALLMIYPSLVPLEFNRIKEVNKNKFKILITLIVNFFVVPLVALVLGYIFLREEPGLWLGLILLAVLPGGGMVTTWALKSKADMPLTVSIVFFNLLTAVFLVPAYLSWAMNKLDLLFPQPELTSCTAEKITHGMVNCFLGGENGGVSPLQIAIPIILIVVIPVFIAYITQRIIKKRYGEIYFNTIKHKFISFSNLGLLIVLLMLSGISDNMIIFEHPEYISKALSPLLLFYGLTLLISWLLGKIIEQGEGLAVFWGTYVRYITLALGFVIFLIYQSPQYSVAIIMIILAYLLQIPTSFWLAKKLRLSSPGRT